MLTLSETTGSRMEEAPLRGHSMKSPVPLGAAMVRDAEGQECSTEEAFCALLPSLYLVAPDTDEA